MMKRTGENAGFGKRSRSAGFSFFKGKGVAAGVVFVLTISAVLWADGLERVFAQVSGTKTDDAYSFLQSRLQQKDQIYEGYARLFVLGHILSRAFGLSGMMPGTINLDVFARQELLAEAGDFYVYRPSTRGDIMWPLIIPTPPREPEIPPTSTPIPEVGEVLQETPTPTPSPTPTPTEVIPPPLKLQVVSHSKTGKLVMIDNQILSVGDTIDQATIVEIGPHHAKIVYYGAPFFVTKKGTVKPEDFHEEDFLFD